MRRRRPTPRATARAPGDPAVRDRRGPRGASHSPGRARPRGASPPPAAPDPAAAAPAPARNGYVATAPANGRTFISPIARRIAEEHQLDVAHIPGTGPGGRIIREDVEAYLAQQQGAATQPALQPVAPTPQPVPAAVPGEEVEAVPLTAMRRTIARRLQQSMQTAPHFYVTMSVDATRLAEFRANANEYAETLPEPIKISYNDLIVKAVALALARMPLINVSFDGERLLLKKHVNVGIAVALEQGLIVPVVRDADKRGLLDIARESRRLAEAARTGKLTPEEFQGGTFSVSNLGMYDVEEFTAVINPPESASWRRAATRLRWPRRPGSRARPHEADALGGPSRDRRRAGGPVPARGEAPAGAADGDDAVGQSHARRSAPIAEGASSRHVTFSRRSCSRARSR